MRSSDSSVGDSPSRRASATTAVLQDVIREEEAVVPRIIVPAGNSCDTLTLPHTIFRVFETSGNPQARTSYRNDHSDQLRLSTNFSVHSLPELIDSDFGRKLLSRTSRNGVREKSSEPTLVHLNQISPIALESGDIPRPKSNRLNRQS